MQKFTVVLIILLCLGIIFPGCWGSKGAQSADEGNVPEWFKNPPTDPNFFYAVNTATSQDLQMSIDKATTGGRGEIARQVETKVTGFQKRFDEEVGLGNDSQLLQQMTQAVKTVVSTSLSGSRVKAQSHSRDGNTWRAYVLIEYPVGAANQALMDQLRNNQNMYTRFRSSQTFKELDDEVEKYEKWKKEQGQ